MSPRFPTIEAYNAAGEAYRDEVVRLVPGCDPKWARAAGGFLAENDGDIDAALTSAGSAGIYRAVEVLAAYSAKVASLRQAAA